MTEIHKNRFGYYPCSWETYRKLKRLNYLRIESLISNARWNRWNRKQPQNRYGQEPYRMHFGDHIQIYEDYQNARYPKQTASEVKPIILAQSQIDTLLSMAEKDYEKLKHSYNCRV
jgi:hypothetical protein